MLSHPVSAAARALGLLGTGMLVWAGISTALLQGRGAAFANLLPLQDLALGSGVGLALCLLLPLLRQAGGRPAWRARALATLVLLLVADVALVFLLHASTRSPGMIALAGAITCLAALATSACALQALDAAPTQWWLPAQLSRVLLAGAVSFFALMAWMWPGSMAGSGVPSLLLLGAISAALALADWLARGRDCLLPFARHRSRWALLAGLLLVPLLLSLVLAWWPSLQRPVWCLAVLAMLALMLAEDCDRSRATLSHAPNAG